MNTLDISLSDSTDLPTAKRLRHLAFRPLPLWIALIAVMTLPAGNVHADGAFGPSDIISADLPDFAALDNPRVRKSEFFEYLLPVVRDVNDEVRAQRERLYEVLDKLSAEQELDATDHSAVAAIAARFRMTAGTPLTASSVRRLLARVDVVPASLVLAQAANESAWGTSRFARQGRNLFGIWCFDPGCGVTPKRRAAGKTHEVRGYASVHESVAHYVHNINTHAAYRELRDIRLRIRSDDLEPNGIELAEGLTRYSERGRDYVREIQSMILSNDLHRFTRVQRLSQL